MELRQLRYFVTVAEELHFGRAARRLHISQPPLSVQIQKLESELEVTLLRRSTRHVELTPAGTELASRLRPVLADLDECFVDLHELENGQRGRLSVGFVSSANYTLLPAAVRQFRSRLPRVALELRPLTSAEQIDGLYNGDIDLGIVRDTPPSATLAVTELLAERLVACVPSAHPFATRSQVRAAELLALPMITFPHSMMPGYVDQVRSLFGSAIGDLRVAQQVIHQETALSFVAAGGGFTVLPESVTHLQPASISAVPICEAPLTSLGFATLPKHEAPATAIFLDCLRNSSAHLSETTVPETTALEGADGHLSAPH
ncbi:LysR family transcriptional regulator [Pseudoclavibacter sp. CFCC 13611]|uniref:LysR family transcriptional regulator n=1 Tax=Pseudoclavibacter sp. CFCC 13611 TaxID=2615178 RepID=UPI00130151AC|nr:LysR family transcriptional regulator [Pseudoclavibacter sp. CFCC 13611]KAB1663919.1 LysR family transcriptional regulator [Pseudoclavibacter sp. CFCC 13611]